MRFTKNTHHSNSFWAGVQVFTSNKQCSTPPTSRCAHVRSVACSFFQYLLVSFEFYAAPEKVKLLSELAVRVKLIVDRLTGVDHGAVVSPAKMEADRLQR